MSRRAISAVVGVVAVAAIVAAVWTVGSPATQRKLRLDRRRVADLSGLRRAVDDYRKRHAALPATPRDAVSPEISEVHLTDPVTGAPYEYRALSANRYQLCATFDAPSPAERGETDFWRHDAGRQCFDIEPQTRP